MGFLSTVWDKLVSIFSGGSENKNRTNVNVSVENKNIQHGGQSNKNEQSSNGELIFDGKYKYKCILFGAEPFPDGNSKGNAHGGTIHIKSHQMKYGRRIELNGIRTWESNGDAVNLELSSKKKSLKHRLKWKAIGAFIPDDKFIYKYDVKAQPLEGISTLEIKGDNTRVLTGEFSYYRVSEGNNSGLNFDKILSKKITKAWAVRTGVVELVQQ